MDYKWKLGILLIVMFSLIAAFLFGGLGSNWDYALPKRGMKIFAIVVTGTAIAIATLIFQTITNNRILTPSIIGLDSLYLFIQTFLIFVFGSQNLTFMNKNVNFLISVTAMMFFAILLYKFLFKSEGQNIYFLLLIGMILGTFFQSFTSFMQVLIDPNEFLIVQDRMFASFNNINIDVLYIAVIILLLAALYLTKFSKYLDVLALGKEHAVNLGVNYDYVVKRLLIIVTIFISVSTALVGPITFLGLLVVNVAYEFFKTYRHQFLLVGSSLISIIALVGGQLIVERVFTFSTTLSVIINFIGGIYFIFLLLKERSRAW
ncbi:iron complex transport system permease protein [Anoxybacillus vitaminiphilus]|uniref:Iron complex transport system permease protein n=1 Tax=Paranoxybacillus vitaminiphilus TaxID=581036 RepID=A0A327YF32_9BACL|nr:iron chelate uptake ABC transporter family permease subunit [Anoxybacillus vitaminiphilus]RAK18686.1 iron complex transport system permease protein [Anoxybacillus vitaminiphilus]